MNRDRIDEVALQGGDEVQIGKYRLVYFASQARWQPAVRASTSPRSRMSIGEVLAACAADFPEVSISKIRFLEAEGLIEPERTPSGYRKFSHRDVERLRYVLSSQREHYLPLKVIRDHLDAMDRGLEPPAVPGDRPPGAAGGARR